MPFPSSDDPIDMPRHPPRTQPGEESRRPPVEHAPVQDMKGKHKPVPGSRPYHDDELGGYSMFRGTFIGIGAAILFGWMPVLGPLIAGGVTGYFSKERYRALYAAFIPGTICSAWYLTISAFAGSPVLPQFGSSIADFAGWRGALFAIFATGHFIMTVLASFTAGWIHERRFSPRAIARRARAS